MDEAFLHLSDMLTDMLSIQGEILDQDKGVHSYIYALEIGTPIELCMVRDTEGRLQLGSIPPLYRVETSFRPSFHNINLKAVKFNETEDGN